MSDEPGLRIPYEDFTGNAVTIEIDLTPIAGQETPLINYVQVHGRYSYSAKLSSHTTT